MAKRVLWDECETVLLIDAYVRVKNKEVSQQEAIKEVSTLLRRRAINSGMQIDEIFRNENGIRMQMMCIQGLMENTPVGLKNTSKLFVEMVELYKTSPNDFHTILNQAKGECAMQVNVEEIFFAWLAKRVPSMIISEFSVLCRNIESYCLSKQIITEPLFETTDTVLIQRIIDTIKSNRMFQFKYFRQLGKMRKIMEHYMMFLREESEKRKNVSEEKGDLNNTLCYEMTSEQESDVELSIDEEEQVSGGCESEEIASIELNEEIINEDIDNEPIVWNFANENIVFSDISPILISYFDCEEKVQGWEDAFVKILFALQEDYPAIIRGMVGCRFSGIEKVVLTGITGVTRFSKPVELNNGIYLEKNCSPHEIVSVVRVLMDKCNVDYDNLEIYYEETTSDIVTTEIQKIDESIVEDNLSSTEGKTDYIVKVLEEHNISYIDNRGNNGCLWIIGDRGLSSVLEIIEKHGAVFHYKEEGGRATKGKSAWWTKELIIDSDEPKENEVVNQSVEDNENTSENIPDTISLVERKAAFENWLMTSDSLTAHLAHKYSSAINVVSRYSVKQGYSENELYHIIDAEQVYQISMKLFVNKEFMMFNDRHHNSYRVALSKYWDFCKSLSSDTAVSASTMNVNEHEDEIKKNRIEFIGWAKTQQIKEAKILLYLLELKKCSEFAQNNSFIKEEHILLIRDINVLERVFLEMQNNRRFVELNVERKNGPVSAMKKLIDFRRDITLESEQTTQPYVSIESTETSAQERQVSDEQQNKERYVAVLKENFVDGFRPSKIIDKKRFRMYYSDMFGEELTKDDESIVKTLMKVGTYRDERIFVKDETEQKELLEEINDTITKTFRDGASCIYLDCLFSKYQKRLAEMLHIYNVDSLESVLCSSEKCNFIKKYNYIYEQSKEPSISNDVIEYMKKSHLPVTYSEMEQDIWYIPIDRVKNILRTTLAIVNVASESYLYAPNLPVSENEINKIAELISHSLLQRNYISDVELMQLIEEHCPSVIMNASYYPWRGIRNALAYLLRDKFSFRGAVISGKDEVISMTEVFSDLCRQSEHLTVDELKQFAKEINTNLNLGYVYSEMIRISKNEFIRKDLIHFDVEQIDSALDKLIQSAYIPIKSFNLFLHFPAIDVPWNNFVLESYVAQYSRKFRLFHSNYAINDCCGAIVREDSGISDYRALIVDVLVKNTGWKNKDDALQMLVDLGYHQKRSYRDIEIVMREAKAKLQRENN